MPYKPNNEITRKMLEIPEGYKQTYYSDSFDNGGPVIIGIMDMTKPEEIRAKYRAETQEAFHRLLDSAERNDAPG